MRTFTCPECDASLWFGNDSCERCGVAVVYDPVPDRFVVDAEPCTNRATAEACNWVVHVDGWCRSCALDVQHDPELLRRPFQEAKRRSLRQLHIFGVDQLDRPPLRFDLRGGTEHAPVTTGHADGLITIDIAEADPAHREELRTSLGEPYRTPLGHVRHELGHWWWQHAVDGRFTSDRFRERFGDERVDYGEALETHYGAPDDGTWRSEYVSHYAASHPWEDFAESFAHVLHLRDTLETAVDHDVVPRLDDDAAFGDLYRRWVELTATLNDLNRSMGMPDPYPFAVPPAAVEKFAFVHDSLRADPTST